MTTQTNFDSTAFNSLMNTTNPWGNHFNGIVAYKGAEVQALSATVGFTEFGSVMDYKKESKDTFFLVEFVGDEGIWNEWVNVNNCVSYSRI